MSQIFWRGLAAQEGWYLQIVKHSPSSFIGRKIAIREKSLANRFLRFRDSTESERDKPHGYWLGKCKTLRLTPMDAGVLACDLRGAMRKARMNAGLSTAKINIIAVSVESHGRPGMAGLAMIVLFLWQAGLG